jgi:signal transduction histidine kinase/CheY-like chemotaxis protein
MSESVPTQLSEFRLLFESAPGLYLALDPGFAIIAVSDAYLAATSTQRSAIVGRNLFDVFPDNPDDATATGTRNLRISLERVVAEGRADTMAVQKYDIEVPQVGAPPRFEERFWSPRNSPVFGPDGALCAIIHCVEDVTDYVRLRQHDSALGELHASLASRAGHMEAEIVRRSQELQTTNESLRRLQADLEARVEERTRALSRAYDDLERAANERLAAQHALARSEEQLRQAQKLEAVGRLAGGIAHDFNNLLTVILSYGEELLGCAPPDTDDHDQLLQIVQAGRRAADLTRQLLAFSRQQVLQPRVLDINEVIANVGRMLERVVGEDIELRIVADRTLGRVRADPGQMEQVLMNLVVNARDAMPSGGHLTIDTRMVDVDLRHAEEHLELTPGRYVVISVTDTGVGMDRETQARVFEPFFTTKEMGKGTGLGLATVFGIVKQSGGNVWLYSEPGRGTTFKIYLPAVDGEAVRLGLTAQRTPLGGNECVLLAEDDEAIRRVAERVLQRAGYRVLAAGTPADALSICDNHGDEIDLLLTDVVMPRMSGLELAEAVVTRRPSVRVLFMSGYSDAAVFRDRAQDPGVAFIQKPLTPDALGRRVREVLEAPAIGLARPWRV